jgi:nucleoside-diphosphate-sugar epimerase
MKALLIGGTGIISTGITRLLADNPDWELYLLNRGSQQLSDRLAPEDAPKNITQLTAEIHDEAKVAELIKEQIGDTGVFDVVVDFISFVPAQIESRYRLFSSNSGQTPPSGLPSARQGNPARLTHFKCKQFIFISSASAYQKPLSDYRVSEATPLANPYWEYSRNKIACEATLLRLYAEERFPVTIVRPSHTYDDRYIPLGVHGDKGSWQNVKRMLDGKPVIIHGDGTSLWTMTHNSDFAKGFVGLMGNLHAIGESVNITSDETLTWNQIYGAIANVLNVELKPCYVSSDFLAKCAPQYDFTGSLIGDKANSVVFDNSKLKRLVPDFCATKRFDQGIRDVIENVLANKELQTEDPEFDAWCDRVIAELNKTIERIKQS